MLSVTLGVPAAYMDRCEQILIQLTGTGTHQCDSPTSTLLHGQVNMLAADINLAWLFRAALLTPAQRLFKIPIGSSFSILHRLLSLFLFIIIIQVHQCIFLLPFDRFLGMCLERGKVL